MTETVLASESSFALHTLDNGRLKIQVLENGSIFAIGRDSIQINQVLASPVAGGIQRIDLRVHAAREVRPIPVVGAQARSELLVSDRAIVWKGADEQVRYRCICMLAPQRDACFFNVEVT